MKTKDIAVTYGINQSSFERWLVNSSDIPHKSGLMGGISIDNEALIDAAVTGFQTYLAENEERVAREIAE